MSRIFPKSCGGLVVGAVFIAASVVQLIAGLILLHSDYADILSRPNFWTATMNAFVGCLLGISASTWKEHRNKKIAIVVAQYKLTAALQVSAIIGNATTCAILFICEGNTLVSVVVEKHSEHSTATINRELLGYAYAASVISPALCIIACTISLVWNCCPAKTEKQIKKKTHIRERRRESRKSALSDSNEFQWIYSADDFMMGKAVPKSMSLSSCSDCDYGFNPKNVYFVSPPEAQYKKGCYRQSTNSDFGSSSPFCDDAENCRECFHNETLDATFTSPMDATFTSPMNATFTSPLAGEIIPVQIRCLSKSPRRIGKAVLSPVPPDHWSSETLVKTPVISSFVQPSGSTEKFPPVPNNNLQKPLASHLSVKVMKNECLKRSPREAEHTRHEIREEKFKKMSPMDAIIEDAQEARAEYKMSGISPSIQTSGYGSSPDIPRSSRLPTPPPRLTSKLTTCVCKAASKKRLFQDCINTVEVEDDWM